MIDTIEVEIVYEASSVSQERVPFTAVDSEKKTVAIYTRVFQQVMGKPRIGDYALTLETPNKDLADKFVTGKRYWIQIDEIIMGATPGK